MLWATILIIHCRHQETLLRHNIQNFHIGWTSGDKASSLPFCHPAAELISHLISTLHNKSCFLLIRSNKMQHYAGIYLLQNYSTCFGCPSHPSSGVSKTVTAASGTGHSIWATTFLQRGQWPRWRKVFTTFHDMLPHLHTVYEVILLNVLTKV